MSDSTASTIIAPSIFPLTPLGSLNTVGDAVDGAVVRIVSVLDALEVPVLSGVRVTDAELKLQLLS
jgi:hypothetical protein